MAVRANPRMDLVEVRVSCPSEDVAAEIGRAAVEARLAACAHVSPLRSVYRWRGEVHEDAEWSPVLRSRRDLLPRLAALIRQRHPYELPAIMSRRGDGGVDRGGRVLAARGAAHRGQAVGVWRVGAEEPVARVGDPGEVLAPRDRVVARPHARSRVPSASASSSNPLAKVRTPSWPPKSCAERIAAASAPPSSASVPARTAPAIAACWPRPMCPSIWCAASCPRMKASSSWLRASAISASVKPITGRPERSSVWKAFGCSPRPVVDRPRGSRS